MTSCVDMCTGLTKEQQEMLTDAATKDFICMEGSDPFAIRLLEAAKHNPDISALFMFEAAIMRSDVVFALADFVSTHPMITKISFSIYRNLFRNKMKEGQFRGNNAYREDGMTLMAAMKAYQSRPKVEERRVRGNRANREEYMTLKAAMQRHHSQTKVEERQVRGNRAYREGYMTLMAAMKGCPSLVTIFAGACEAVSLSRSMKKFIISSCYYVSGVKEMLEQTQSLQALHLAFPHNCSEMEELAVGLKACSTLTTVSGTWTRDVKGISVLLNAILVNQNITEIGGIWSWESLVQSLQEGDDTPETALCMELHFYLAFNSHGRSLVQANIPSSVWPYALKKAGGSSLPHALYYFLRESPELVMHSYTQ